MLHDIYIYIYIKISSFYGTFRQQNVYKDIFIFSIHANEAVASTACAENTKTLSDTHVKLYTKCNRYTFSNYCSPLDYCRELNLTPEQM